MDGILPARVERPGSISEVAELVDEINMSGEWLLPVGGGTSLTAANVVDDIPLALDLAGLQGIEEYEPTDLTVSVLAGTTWASLQRELGENGQTIPVDAPFPDQATVGGMVATGYAGPRRMRDGSVKDLLLGASFVRGDGLAAKAGGMVVKNVTGFEIPRLLHGSWGSLAVITSVNLKVVPKHEHDMTLVSDQLEASRSVEQVLDLTRRRSAIVAAVVDGNIDEGCVALRLTGLLQPTRELAREIQDEGILPWAELIDDAQASGDYWQQRENRLATASEKRVSLEIGTQPAATLETIGALRTAVPGISDYSFHVSPGTGAIVLSFSPASCSLDAWTRIWHEHGFDDAARYVINHAPRSWRAASDVWSVAEGPRKIMQSLKSTFDPNDTLNRGRLWTNAPVMHQ